MIIIGICGKMGTGKSTLAADLAARLGGVVLHFADDIYAAASLESGIPVATLRQRPILPEHRALLQRVADAKRAEDPAYFVKRMALRLVALGNPAAVIIDDLRKPEEEHLVKAFCGLTVQLHPYPGYEPAPGWDHNTELYTMAAPDFRFTPPHGGLPAVADVIVSIILGERRAS